MRKILDFLETGFIVVCSVVAAFGALVLVIVFAVLALLISPFGWIAAFFAGLYFLLTNI